MMLNLLTAEWQKATKNYLLTGFLVWVFPVGVGAFMLIMVVAAFLSETAAIAMVTTSSGQWTVDMQAIWIFVTSFPGNIFGRMLPLAFMAVVFASEYQLQTWKNLVPRSSRSSLILSKFIVLIALLMLSLLIASIIIGIGQSIGHALVDAPYGPELSVSALGKFIEGYGREVLLAAASLILLAGYAAISAILTRSILGSLLLGFGFSVFEPMTFAFLLLLGNLLNAPKLINLYQFIPTYNLDNVRSWLVHQSAWQGVSDNFTAAPSLLTSIFWVILWVAGLIALSLYLFQKQDLTE